MLDFESQLHTSLKPVYPDGKFVTNLRSRLLKSPDTVLEGPDDSTQWLSSVLLASAVVAVNLGFGLILLRLISPHSRK